MGSRDDPYDGPDKALDVARRRDLTWKFLRGVDAYRDGHYISADLSWDDGQREAYRDGWVWARKEMRRNGAGR